MAFKAEPPINPWETHALNYNTPVQGLVHMSPSQYPSVKDGLIYPGLYSGTGFDLMAILLQVRGRPHPRIDLGPVDCSVAVVVSDLELPDMPIVYASDAFCELTGYPQNEVLGQNCRFLQSPGPGSPPGSRVDTTTNKVAIQNVRHAVHTQQEIQTQLCNYKRNGQPFTNILTIIPIQLHGHRYAVGFQCDAGT